MKSVDDGMPENNGWKDPIGDVQAAKDALANGARIAYTFYNLPQMVADYVTHIESGTTARAGCECEWITHPDDIDKEEGKRRVRKGEANLECPVHTREGFILGFFKWVDAQ